MITKFHVPRRRSLLFVSLLVVVLVSSCFISVFVGGSSFVLGASGTVVSNETELRNVINNAVGSTTIVIDKDITLTDSALLIPASKDITLTGNKVTGFYKLIGASGKSTITVESGGVLRLDDIIVTHVNNAFGSGVTVSENGHFSMYSGEISGNSAVLVGYWGSSTGLNSYGGGVQNSGVFEMHGGKISNNKANSGFGGGVYNKGTFKLMGGEISNNEVIESTSTGGYGGGVYNGVDGSFIMSGGKISNNKAVERGGGVCNWGIFERLDGVISGNTDWSGSENDVYTKENSNNSSDGSSSSGSNGSGGGSSNGSGLSDGDGFSLREVVVICIGVVGVTLAVVMAVLLFTFKKGLNTQKKRQTETEYACDGGC